MAFDPIAYATWGSFHSPDSGTAHNIEATVDLINVSVS